MIELNKYSKGTDITLRSVSLRTDTTTHIQLQGPLSLVVCEYLPWFSSEQLFFLAMAIKLPNHSFY
jgi:hypothetical protein